MAGRLNSFTPFSYRAGKTVLHRLPAGLKLLSVIAVSAAAFSTIYGLAISIAVLLIVSSAARIAPWVLLKGSRPLVVLACLIIILKTVRLETPMADIHGLIEGLGVSLRILVTFTAAALLFTVTTIRELRLSLASLELTLKRLFFRLPAHPGSAAPSTAYFSLGLSLMLGFIPRFFELWEISSLACEARSCRRGLRRMFILVPLVTERMMEAAAETAQALVARGLNSSG